MLLTATVDIPRDASNVSSGGGVEFPLGRTLTGPTTRPAKPCCMRYPPLLISHLQRTATMKQRAVGGHVLFDMPGISREIPPSLGLGIGYALTYMPASEVCSNERRMTDGGEGGKLDEMECYQVACRGKSRLMTRQVSRTGDAEQTSDGTHARTQDASQQASLLSRSHIWSTPSVHAVSNLFSRRLTALKRCIPLGLCVRHSLQQVASMKEWQERAGWLAGLKGMRRRRDQFVRGSSTEYGVVSVSKNEWMGLIRKAPALGPTGSWPI